MKLPWSKKPSNQLALHQADTTQAQVVKLTEEVESLTAWATEITKTVQRIERKVYRDIAKGNGEMEDVLPAVTKKANPPDFSKLNAGDEVPPEMLQYL